MQYEKNWQMKIHAAGQNKIKNDPTKIRKT